MATPIGAETAKLAGLQIDLLQKIRNGQVSFEQLNWWLNLSIDTRDSLMIDKAVPKPVSVKFNLDLDRLLIPSKFFGENYSFWKDPLTGLEDCIPEPEVIDFAQVVPKNYLMAHETRITIEEWMKRANASPYQQLGAKAFLALWNDWKKCEAQGEPEESVIEKLLRVGKVSKRIFFFGFTLQYQAPRNGRFLVCLNFYGKQWHWETRWFGHPFFHDIFAITLPSF